MNNISPEDFYIATPFNQVTKNQIWMSQIADSHDNICYCQHPFAHLLASIFPPGHKDRDLTINQILLRDYKEKCLSGGTEEKGSGDRDIEGATTSENIKQEIEGTTEEENIEDLLAAVDAAEAR